MASSSPDAAQQPPGSPVRPSTAAARSGGSGRPAADEDAVAVRVAVHIRPLVENELAKGCQEILDVAPNAPQISVGQHAFAYDNVYGSGGGDSAANLYPDCVQPLVDGLFRGYNATVFAYGQTGSGKTFTMGSAWQPEEGNEGVIPNVMDELFTRVDSTQHTDFTIKVSFVEIHKEEVRDLLWTNSSAPRPVVTIRELPTGVSLAGAVEKPVRSREEMSHLLMQGTLMRAVAATNMNNRSSRSHAIFTITLEQRRRQLVRPASAPAVVARTPGGTPMQDGDSSSSGSSEGDEDEDDEADEAEAGDEYLIAKMHLVDLAGSERAKRTGAEGARLKEAININKGLLALAKVITALVDAQSHVPYRDSKLTRLLQDSLGGNSRTVMIACVSPADINREETLNTLRYADRARRIKNKPVINRDPMAAQLAALRQQIAGLRAENLALRTALGGDREAAVALAAAGRAGQGGVASEALQQAYDDLALRFGALEVDNAKQQIELDAARNEGELLRSGLLTAETQRDQLLLRLQSLQAAAAVSSDPAMHAALTQDASAAALTQDAQVSSPAAVVAGAETDAGAATSDGGAAAAAAPEAAADADAAAAVPTTIAQRAAAAGLLADVGVVAALRARVSELEGELRQVRSLHRMTSNVLVRGLSSSMRASNASGSRAASSSGGFGQRSASAAAALGARPGSRLASNFPSLLEGGGGADADVLLAGGFIDAHDHHDLDAEDAGLASPVTPARPGGLGGGDLLGEPLMEVAPDAEMLAQSAAHMVAREAMATKLEVLARQMEAKQKRLMALQGAADIEGAKSKYMAELQKERDGLAKEKTALLQKLAAVTQASAEERKRLECAYKEKLGSVERRLKELAEREKAAKRSAAQLGRVQAVCGQLQSDIARMKAARAAVQRRMEAKEKEFREWRLQREREVLQLRRNAQRQDAALQQHQAMHCKQQAVLKRKTEEAEAARRKLRELMELQARVRRDKATAQAGALEAGDPRSRDVELQPNATAPLLRNSKARRNWIDQEMELCSTSWQYQKVLDGELAQRADATRKLREVQKQLMLLGGLVPPSPVVTAAAAAASRRRSGSGPGAAVLSLPEEDVLLQDAGRLQAAIDQHTRSVKELQEQWERAQAEEQSRGAGAADVRRWTGIRNIIEAREMLRTLFVSACAQRAQVYESQMELAKLQESNDILEIRLDMALQQAAEARRKAVEAEATTAAVMATPARQLALVAAGSSGSGSEPGSPVGSAPEPGQQQLLVGGSSLRRRSSAAGAGDAGVRRRTGSLDGSVAAATPQDLGDGSIAGLSSGEVHRDETDIEADALLHSMGLPPIQEHPELQLQGSDGLPPALAERTTEARGRTGARTARAWQALSGPGAVAAAAGAGPSSGGVDSPRHSRTSALLRAAAEGWVSQEGGNAGSVSGGRGSASGAGGRGRSTAAAAAAAQGLAAKLDALECDWQGYKRSAAAAGGGSARRSLSSGGLVRGGYSGGRSSSVPASPRVSGVGAASCSGGQPGSAAGAANAQQQRSSRRISLSANSSPVRQGEGPLHASRTEPFWQHRQQEEAVASAAAADSGPGMGAVAKAGAAAAGNTGAKQPQQQQQQSLLMRGLGSILKLGRDAVAAASRGPSRSDDDASGGVAKSLTFLEADDNQQHGTADVAGSPSAYASASSCSGSSPEGHGRGGSDSGGARRAKKQPWRRRGRQPEAAADSADSDESVLALSGAQQDGAAGDAAAAAAGGGARGRRRHTAQQQRQQEASSSAELESTSDAADEDDDNEAADPSYDPVLHATPAAGRTRGARQAAAAAAAAAGNGGRAGRSTRASRASTSSEHGPRATAHAAGGSAGDSGGSSRRSSSSHQQQATAQQGSGSLSAGSSAAASVFGAAAAAAALPASGSAATATAAAGVVAPPRALAAQVSFNHEKRQGWERPVLEAINAQRAGQGLAPVDKLTVQLLKEHMAGQQVDGRPWAPGNKSKDSLIAEYRRVLALTDGGDAETDIDRITGAANWPMPASHSLPCSPTPGGSSWAAAARRGADAEAAAAAAAAAAGGGSRPQSGAGARRVVSASLPASPSGMLASSPQHALQQQHASSSRIPAVGSVSPSQQQQQQRGAGSSGNSPPSPGFGGASPRIAHASPRVVREWQAGSGGGASPAAGAFNGGGSRVSRGGRMPLPGVLVQSAEGGLLQAGAGREHAGAVLQQAAQRSLRSSLSGSSSKPKVALPNSARTDGPWSARGPNAVPGGSGSAERSRSNSINASSGQPSWR